MTGKMFIVRGDLVFGPVPFNYFSIEKNRYCHKDREEVKKLDIGERYDLDVCSKCGVGKGERVITRVV